MSQYVIASTKFPGQYINEELTLSDRLEDIMIYPDFETAVQTLLSNVQYKIWGPLLTIRRYEHHPVITSIV